MSDEVKPNIEPAGLEVGWKILMFVVVAALIGIAVASFVTFGTQSKLKISETRTMSSIVNEVKFDSPNGGAILRMLSDQNARSFYADKYFVEEEWMKFSDLEKKNADAIYAERMANIRKQANSVKDESLKKQVDILVDIHQEDIESGTSDINRKSSDFVAVFTQVKLTCKAVESGASASSYIDSWDFENSLSSEYFDLSKLSKAEREAALATAGKAMKGAVAVGVTHLCGASS